MVSKNLPVGIKICNTCQIWLFGGCVKARESLYAWVIMWFNTILKHIDSRRFCLSMKVLVWYIDPNGIENKSTVKSPYPTGIKKMWNPHYRYSNGIEKRRYQTNIGFNLAERSENYILKTGFTSTTLHFCAWIIDKISTDKHLTTEHLCWRYTEIGDWVWVRVWEYFVQLWNRKRQLQTLFW